jgi:hypothetical protein
MVRANALKGVIAERQTRVADETRSQQRRRHDATHRCQGRRHHGSKQRTGRSHRRQEARGTITISSTPHAPNREYEVTPLELFFDLAFVFAVSQLSLAEQPTWQAGLKNESGLARLAGWYT